MVLATLDDDASALREQGRTLAASLTGIMERHFTGPTCQGMCRGFLTIQTVQAPAGRISGETGPPSENTRTMMRQAHEAAEIILADIAAIMDGDVAAYRDALRAAGYTPFGNEGEDR